MFSRTPRAYTRAFAPSIRSTAAPSSRLLSPNTTSLTASYLQFVRTMASHQKTLTQAIKEDHQEMYEYYDQYKKAAAEGNADAQERWSRQLIWEVARHAVGEEIVVYPLMEKYLGSKGKELADHDRADHQKVKEMLYNIESLSPASAEYSHALDQVMEHLRPHNEDEENTDLPLLEPEFGEDHSKQYAKQFTRTKKFVPTRSHPSAPNKPPFETFAGFLAAPMDKLKDAFSKFPTDEMKQEL